MAAREDYGRLTGPYRRPGDRSGSSRRARISGRTGAIELLAGAISYPLGTCAPITPAEMTLPTPCADWDLATLLAHLGESMRDLETALRTGRLTWRDRPAAPGATRWRCCVTGRRTS